jgi:hypothetical protein
MKLKQISLFLLSLLVMAQSTLAAVAVVDRQGNVVANQAEADRESKALTKKMQNLLTFRRGKTSVSYTSLRHQKGATPAYRQAVEQYISLMKKVTDLIVQDVQTSEKPLRTTGAAFSTVQTLLDQIKKLHDTLESSKPTKFTDTNLKSFNDEVTLATKMNQIAATQINNEHENTQAGNDESNIPLSPKPVQNSIRDVIDADRIAIEKLRNFESSGDKKPLYLSQMQSGAYTGTSFGRASETYDKMLVNFTALTKALANSTSGFNEHSAAYELFLTSKTKLETVHDSMQIAINHAKGNPKRINASTLSNLEENMKTALTVISAFEHITKAELGKSTQIPGLESLPRSGDFTLEDPKTRPTTVRPKNHSPVSGTVDIPTGSGDGFVNDPTNSGGSSNREPTRPFGETGFREPILPEPEDPHPDDVR